MCNTFSRNDVIMSETSYLQVLHLWQMGRSEPVVVSLEAQQVWEVSYTANVL
jgi:hypothetical protein